jgi:CRP/FNR family transcriptional regulator
MACLSALRIQTGLLGRLDAADRDYLEKNGNQREYGRKETVFREGAEADGVYLVSRGSLKIYKTGPNGHEQILRIAGPGELAGYRALLAGETYSASADAREPSQVTYFSKRLFSDLFRRSPSAAEAFIEALAKELRQTRERLLERRDQDASARLARCLVDLQGRRPGPVSVARLELADMIGAAPETVSRLLRHFSDHRFVQLKGRKIELTDREHLNLLAKPAEFAEAGRG